MQDLQRACRCQPFLTARAVAGDGPLTAGQPVALLNAMKGVAIHVRAGLTKLTRAAAGPIAQGRAGLPGGSPLPHPGNSNAAWQAWHALAWRFVTALTPPPPVSRVF
jgi:hypothetical protein